MCLYSGKVDEKPKQRIYRSSLLLSTDSISNDIASHEREIACLKSQRKRLFIEPAELAGIGSAIHGFKSQSLTVFDETLEFRY